MEAKVTWKGNLSFTGTSNSGFTVPLGSGPSEDSEDGFRPLELMAISLAGCTGMDVISILKKKQQAVTGFEVRVQAENADDFPKVFTNIMVEYIVTGHAVDPVAVARSIELSVTKYCPAQAMLEKAVHIEHKYTILEG